MKRVKIFAAAFSAGLLGLAGASYGAEADQPAESTEAQGFEVKAIESKITAIIDQARLFKVPAGTQTVIIGNSTIADVTLLQKNGIMILTPKAFGETNFIALDGSGNPVAESTIQVVSGRDKLIMQPGGEAERGQR